MVIKRRIAKDPPKMEDKVEDRWSKYNAEETKLVAEARRKQRSTTESANAALKVAENTKDLASTTLANLQSQSNTMMVVDNDMHEIQADVREAKGVLKYMRRCCLCFLCSCCCSCDPLQGQEESRKARVKGRDRGRAQMRANFQQATASMAVPPDDVILPVGEEKAREELLGKGSITQVQAEGSGIRHLHGLDEWDAQALTQEAEEQDQALDKIDDVLHHLKNLGTEIGAEITRQALHLESLAKEVDSSQQDIIVMTRGAKKNFRV